MTHSASYRRILSRMGYYNYQRGLIFHHLDEEGSWNNHLNSCRDFVLRAVEYYRPSIITVLGSGWLLDLPLKELIDEVTEINLVDIVHPPEVKEQVLQFQNVKLREDDITGGLINELWKKAGRKNFFNKLSSTEGIEINEYRPQFEAGMIISLNILTQLESLPLAFLKKKSRADEESYLRFRKTIQQKHIQFLERHKSVLITDVSEIVTSNSGIVREIRSVLVDLPQEKLKEEWTWNFDFHSSDYYLKKSVFKVTAILL